MVGASGYRSQRARACVAPGEVYIKTEVGQVGSGPYSGWAVPGCQEHLLAAQGINGRWKGGEGHKTGTERMGPSRAEGLLSSAFSGTLLQTQLAKSDPP